MNAAIDRLFASRGFVKAGGMWGDAQWKRLTATTIVSVGGGYSINDFDGDFTRAPAEYGWPTKVWIYHGAGCVGHDLSEGEAPVDERAASTVYCNIAEALAAVERLERNLRITDRQPVDELLDAVLGPVAK